jgi:uncharacterized protein YkwD
MNALRRPLRALALAAAVTALTPAASQAATACSSAALTPAADNLGQVAGSILCLVNQERTSRGLPRLRANDRLESAAAKHSRNMVAQSFFSHDSPGGSSVLSRIKASGYLGNARGFTVGENIAYGTGHYATPRETVDSWMHSAGHRANILHAQFSEIGVGIALGAPGQDGGATYTTDFGARL